MGSLGFSEILLILVICLVVFGPSKLPEIGKAFGKGIREFKSAVNTDDSRVDKSDDTSHDKK